MDKYTTLPNDFEHVRFAFTWRVDKESVATPQVINVDFSGCSVEQLIEAAKYGMIVKAQNLLRGGAKWRDGEVVPAATLMPGTERKAASVQAKARGAIAKMSSNDKLALLQELARSMGFALPSEQNPE